MHALALMAELVRPGLGCRHHLKIHFVAMRVAAVLFFVGLLSTYTTAQQSRDGGCLRGTVQELRRSLVRGWEGYKGAPAGIVRPSNLKWEIPVAATTGVLIAAVDRPMPSAPLSPSTVKGTDTAANALLGAQVGLAILSYGVGCATNRDGLRDTAFSALAAMGYAVGNNLLLKAAFNREYPDKWNGHGQFWGGGKSFPSGHSAAAFGMASAIARRNPRHRWLTVAVFTSSFAVAVLRQPARKHYASDILVGATLGYVSGRWLAGR
ncbi:MAG TPA: phosphatase PAP2 family protein [Terriglobales bacterium]|nr:phosphatase PAP2 family protein [Terriglobales bacterium]